MSGGARSSIRLATLLAVAGGVPGCYNAVVFYETGKASLTIEGRPDPSAPVQGNLGFKQRSVVVAPPQDDGEAAAMISSFRFGKPPGLFGPVDIRTALVTGEAATALDRAGQSRVAAAVSGLSIPTYAELATLGIETAREDGHGALLEELAAKRWLALPPEARRRLGEITGFGDEYDASVHDAIRDALGMGSP